MSNIEGEKREIVIIPQGGDEKLATPPESVKVIKINGPEEEQAGEGIQQDPDETIMTKRMPFGKRI